jgi:hypothetical protein
MLQWYEKDGSRAGELVAALADVLPPARMEELKSWMMN